VIFESVLVITVCRFLCMHADSDFVLHGPPGLHVLLCACSVACCQTDTPHAELSTVRYWPLHT